MKKFGLFILIFLSAISLSAQKTSHDKEQVYIFGVGMNLADSTVYVTAPQLMENAQLEKKTKFLENRTFYSLQLRNFLEGYGLSNPICSTFFAEGKKNIDKEYSQIQKHFNKKFQGKTTFLRAEDFTYKPYRIAGQADEDETVSDSDEE